MSVNNKEFQILVIYFTKSKIINEKYFDSFSNFGLLLEYFNKNIKNDSYQLKQNYLLNNIQIKNTDLLIDLIKLQNPSQKIKNAKFSIEIEETNKIGYENYPIFKKILQPFRIDKSIYIFTPEDGIMSLEQYPENIINKYEFEKFNLSSAYCNSPNALYISGGLFFEEKINHFWIIDNEYFTIKKINMPFPKSIHSMTYIFNNGKELIFIAGGDDLKTFYYDIKNNSFVEWGDMNGIHYLPGLIHIGNYLYCFHLINDENNKVFFERTNLNDNNHIWEKIYPFFEPEQIKNNIINNEYGVCYCDGGKVNLCGGNFNNPNCYLYDINKNLFLYNEKCKDQFLPLIDKNFYKINDNHNIALPASLYRHVQVAIFNKKKYTLRIVRFNPSDGNKKMKYKNIYQKDSINGKVIIEINNKDINQTNINNEEENKTKKFNNKNTNVNPKKQKEKYNKNINIKDNEEQININNIENNEKMEFNKIGNNFNINPDINNINENNIQLDDNNNVVIEDEKNDDYLINEENNNINIQNENGEENVNYENNEGNEYEDTNEEMEEIYNDQYYDGVNMMVNDEGEEEVEEGLERYKFEITIGQNIDEDIIQIESFPNYYFDENNFCDYEYEPEENK